jgi:two-component system, response regulator
MNNKKDFVGLMNTGGMPHTILIVDDNPDDIEITKIALAEMGRKEKVEIAMRGEAAMKRLREGKDLPSLILLDLKMPGMSGIDTLRQIRGDGCLKDIPVVIVTSSSLESDKGEAYDAGANDYLHKAFDIDQFSRELNSLLDSYLKN